MFEPGQILNSQGYKFSFSYSLQMEFSPLLLEHYFPMCTFHKLRETPHIFSRRLSKVVFSVNYTNIHRKNLKMYTSNKYFPFYFWLLFCLKIVSIAYFSLCPIYKLIFLDFNSFSKWHLPLPLRQCERLYRISFHIPMEADDNNWHERFLIILNRSRPTMNISMV